MSADSGKSEHEHPEDASGLDDTAVHGIVVEEPLDVENIELGERHSNAFDMMGWETVPALDRTLDTVLDDPDLLAGVDGVDEPTPPQPATQLERLEEEQLRMAAELARLRTDSAARERQLETELAEARQMVAAREAEITDQVAQIASLTLECTGLRSRVQGDDLVAPARPASAAPEEMVARLKQRLEERGRAIAVLRSDVEALARECDRLRQQLGEAPAEPAAAHHERVRHFGRQVLDLLRRIRWHARAGEHDPALAGAPGTEVPTLAVDPPPAEPLPLLRKPRRTAPRRPVRSASAPVPRRYLLALGEEGHQVEELKRGRTYIGRGAEADLRLGDVTVSRLHAVLLSEGGAVMVEDASSTNGVFVNQRRVRRAMLNDGDTVTFGTVRFQYRIGPPPGQ